MQAGWEGGPGLDPLDQPSNVLDRERASERQESLNAERFCPVGGKQVVGDDAAHPVSDQEHRTACSRHGGADRVERALPDIRISEIGFEVSVEGGALTDQLRRDAVRHEADIDVCLVETRRLEPGQKGTAPLLDERLGTIGP